MRTLYACYVDHRDGRPCHLNEQTDVVIGIFDQKWEAEDASVGNAIAEVRWPNYYYPRKCPVYLRPVNNVLGFEEWRELIDEANQKRCAICKSPIGAQQVDSTGLAHMACARKECEEMLSEKIY
jgi:hypothetical protein